MARTVRAPSMLHSSAAYSRRVPVRRATERSVFIGMMMKRGELCITEEDMFVGSRSDIELEMRRREPTRLKWICTPGDSGPEI